MSKILEIACFNLDSALIAQNSGADRIELCTNYTMGGLTPSHQNILEAQKQIQIPIQVIVRPHARNFIYTDLEISQMKNDILFCKENKIDGVVFGILNFKNEIDTNICKELIALAINLMTNQNNAEKVLEVKGAFPLLMKRITKTWDPLLMKTIRNISLHEGKCKDIFVVLLITNLFSSFFFNH